MSLALGPDAMNSRPARPSSSQLKERSGAARLERRGRLRRRGLDQGIELLERRVEDAQRDSEEYVRGERPEQQQRDRGPDHVGDPARHETAGTPGDEAIDQHKEPGKAQQMTKVAAAIAHTLNGCPLVTGSSPIRTRIEFCHSAARHRNTAAVAAQKKAMTRLAMPR